MDFDSTNFVGTNFGAKIIILIFVNFVYEFHSQISRTTVLLDFVRPKFGHAKLESTIKYVYEFQMSDTDSRHCLPK